MIIGCRISDVDKKKYDDIEEGVHIEDVINPRRLDGRNYATYLESMDLGLDSTNQLFRKKGGHNFLAFLPYFGSCNFHRFKTRRALKPYSILIEDKPVSQNSDGLGCHFK